MPLLIWKPEYSVNREDLDHHHQEMFHILNSVYDNLMDSQELSFFLPSINRLSAIARYHLSLEEQCLREMHVPDFDYHVAKHREFTESIEIIRNDYEDNYLEASKELIILLGEWLFNHVLKEDRKYSHMMGIPETAGKSQVNQ
ncbi:MAG: bacteriohemerythrin [Oryzomonas sp.]|uniref:bacteriohemerythrin n=1 Tax=Oryzomonas sp. TaxID=2855186 RepID=UPI00284FD793|nr:bacteriohemerythrin [Oryzomonas sp.]MDR3578593.1 bacteriohemerythrin [Oryzomonas sp.]